MNRSESLIPILTRYIGAIMIVVKFDSDIWTPSLEETYLDHCESLEHVLPEERNAQEKTLNQWLKPTDIYDF